MGAPYRFLAAILLTYGDYDNPAKQPTFPTTFKAGRVRQHQDSLLITATPTRLIFEQEGTVVGVSWLGIVDTMLSTFDSSNYPSQAEYGLAQVPVSEWRTLAIGTPDEALNYLFRSFAARNFVSNASEYLIFGMRQENAITFMNGGAMQNCAFGAMQPCDPTIVGGAANKRSIVGLYSDKEVIADGIRLFGNVKLSSEKNEDSASGYSFSKVKLRQGAGNNKESYRFTGHSMSVFSCQNGNTVSRLILGSRTETTNNGTIFNSNRPWNNWTLLNNNDEVATSVGTASNAGWKAVGPAFNRLVDGLVDRIEPHGQRQFNQTNITNVANSTVSGGFDGMFGNYNGTYTSDVGDDTKYTRGVGFAGYGKFTKYSEEVKTNDFNSFFRKAGSGVIPSIGAPDNYVAGLNVGEAGQDDDRTTNAGLFTSLNIKLRGYKAGCDVTTGRIIGSDVVF